MSERNFSFSVKPSDITNHALITELKGYSIRNGIKFNHIVLEGLKLYKEKHNAQVQR